MSWRVVVSDAALGGLGESDRHAVTAELFAWVEAGPPRRNRRMLGVVEMYEDEVPSGYRVSYFVEESMPYVAIVRVRKTLE